MFETIKLFYKILMRMITELFLIYLVAATFTGGAKDLFAAEIPVEAAIMPAESDTALLWEAQDYAQGLPELNDSSTLADYLRYAAANNPGLEAAFNRWRQAAEKIPQARSLPDPRLTYSYYIREVETRVGPQRQRLGLAQTFPFFGKLSLREKVAVHNAEAERQRYQAARNKLFYRVKRAWYEYQFLGRAIEINEENLDLLTHLESVVRTKYTAGAANYSDLIKAQVELARFEDRLNSSRDRLKPVAAELNAALNRDLEAPPPPTGRIDMQHITPTGEQLTTLLRDGNPDLKALDLTTRGSRAAVDLARKDFYPDFTLGLDYVETAGALMPGTPDDGKNPLMAMVSINLPLWRGKYRAAEREAGARTEAAVQERREKENVLLARLQTALFNFRDARRKIELYDSALLPKAEQSLGAVQQAFVVGNTDFLDLIDAQRTLLEFQLVRERALVDLANSLAEIEMLVGVSISSPAH